MENTNLVQLILNFVADVIRYTVWPVAILVLLFVFRRPIVRLLDRFRRGGIKAGDKEFFLEADTLGKIRKEKPETGLDCKRLTSS